MNALRLLFDLCSIRNTVISVGDHFQFPLGTFVVLFQLRRRLFAFMMIVYWKFLRFSLNFCFHPTSRIYSNKLIIFELCALQFTFAQTPNVSNTCTDAISCKGTSNSLFGLSRRNPLIRAQNRYTDVFYATENAFFLETTLSKRA